ncbi:MAG: glutamate-1-semialdehyde 2,1-aminomutase [Thermoprotei archaeon]|nr:MAG: glutamate-1-semialdehyde 2,1-aminomutase [Thermoprotei archaeon]
MNLGNLYEELLSKLAKRTPSSRMLYERARKVLPMGVTYHIRFMEPYPFYVKYAKGANIWDVDGNIYDDYWIGHGALILGHAPKPVIDAVREQLDKGSHYGFAHELEIKLAELIVKHVPNVESVRFTNSGTEANMYAIRLARAYTGRKRIVKIEGGWHGGYDSLHTGVKPPFKGPESAGLPEESIKYTVSVPFNDLEAMERAIKGGDVAAVVMEPVLGAGGSIPARREYLKGVRELCDGFGTLLIFDEVITGFRLALGGGQEYYGVDADIVVMGKIIGGGFPIGAFGSRYEIMELLDYKKCTEKTRRSFHGGTFTGNPVSMVAGIATIKVLEREGVYERLNAMGEYMIKGLRRIASHLTNPVYITGSGSIIGVHFTKREPINACISLIERWSDEVYRVLHKYMLLRNIVYIGENMAHFMLSTGHTKEMIDRFLAAFEDFIKLIGKELKSGGS